VLDGSRRGEPTVGARGQILAPWTNRLRDGRYEFEGRVHQLPVTDVATGTALHGLVAGRSWSVVHEEDGTVALGLRLTGEEGYPWQLQLTATYTLDDDGLTVVHDVENLSASRAPYAIGAHPYVMPAAGLVDDWVVTLDASHVMLVDEHRMLPVGTVEVSGADLDFRAPRRLASVRLNHAFTGLGRGEDGRAHASVASPGTGAVVTVWAGEGCRWMQLYTGDHDPAAPRRSLAVEPMSAPADAFRSGQDLVVLAPAGHPGSSHRMRWGIGADQPA
jgi:aldose 1-epimerase